MGCCVHCGKDSAHVELRLCSACDSVAYCSASCQKDHWPTHKLDCRLHSNSGIVPEKPAFTIPWKAEAGKHSIKPTMTSATSNPHEPNHVLYITLQNGEIYRWDGSEVKLWADHKALIEGIESLPPKMPFFDERGLLTMKFNPGKPGTYFLVYSRAFRPGELQELAQRAVWFGPAMSRDDPPMHHPMDHVSVLAYVESPDGIVKPLWEIPQPQFNHNGGGLFFSPVNPSILYWALGDGGGMDDMHGELHNGKHVGYALNPTKPYGKLWRIRVNTVDLWERVDTFTRPQHTEMIAKGLRNPWRLTMYSEKSKLLIVSDVGQDKYESIKAIPLYQPELEPHNMGWKLREGFHAFTPELLSHEFAKETPRDPVVEYKRDGSRTFATVGLAFDPTTDRLVFADYSGLIFSTEWPPAEHEVHNPPVLTDRLYDPAKQVAVEVGLHSLAQDGNGQIYALFVDLEHRVNKVYSVSPKPPVVHTDSNSGVVRGNPAIFYPLEVPTLNEQDYDIIFEAARKAVRGTKSGLRKRNGKATHVVMQIVVMPRHDPQAWRFKWDVGAQDDDTAWDGSKDIARAKAYTSLAFSSNQNALTSRQIGELSQPGQVLWGIGDSNRDMGIITFPGGVPLYRDGKLIGAVGVSGDGVDQDETVALAAAKGYEAK